jgi:hypothetical protein
MNTPRSGLPPMPARIAALPVGKRGYPIPFFVAMVDGEPCFQLSDPIKRRDCIKFQLCWVCGQRLGRFKCFPVGPMCTVNRISAEPPSHLECAEWSVKACPFLLHPNAARHETELTRANEGNVPGVMIKRNPGVTALWVTAYYAIKYVDNGILFGMGPPTTVTWWKEGRLATGEEVEESVQSGLPALVALCEDEEDQRTLKAKVRAAQAFYPAQALTSIKND